MFEQAAAEHDIDLRHSFYIDDALTDVAAGQAAGCTTILVRTGRGLTQMLRDDARSLRGYYVAPHLEQAARWIIHQASVTPAQAWRHGVHWPTFRGQGRPSLEFV